MEKMENFRKDLQFLFPCSPFECTMPLHGLLLSLQRRKSVEATRPSRWLWHCFGIYKQFYIRLFHLRKLEHLINITQTNCVKICYIRKILNFVQVIIFWHSFYQILSVMISFKFCWRILWCGSFYPNQELCHNLSSTAPIS